MCRASRTVVLMRLPMRRLTARCAVDQPGWRVARKKQHQPCQHQPIGRHSQQRQQRALPCSAQERAAVCHVSVAVAASAFRVINATVDDAVRFLLSGSMVSRSVV